MKSANPTNANNNTSVTPTFVQSIFKKSSTYVDALQKRYAQDEHSAAFLIHEGEWKRAALAFIVCVMFHYSIEPFLIKQSTHLSLLSSIVLFIETIAIPLVLIEVFQSIGTDRLHLHHSTLGLVFNWSTTDLSCILFRLISGHGHTLYPAIWWSTMVYLVLYTEDNPKMWEGNRYYRIVGPPALAFLMSLWNMFYLRHGPGDVVVGTIIGTANAFVLFIWFTRNCRECRYRRKPGMRLADPLSNNKKLQ